jgi:predicted Fe-Mo cluster-binding NifX family protein
MKMKAAFPVWENRIAPVFDVARQIHVVEAESGRILQEREELLSEGMPPQRALHLAELGVGTLVCGAISGPLQAMVAAYGIRVIPFVAGNLREVIGAWLRGGLRGDHFAMPGCCGRGLRRARGMRHINTEEYFMNARNQGGRGQGGGQGRGQGGQGRGRMGGPSAGGPVGSCVCPQCGYEETHERGIPCTQKKCPKCSVAMTRK